MGGINRIKINNGAPVNIFEIKLYPLILLNPILFPILSKTDLLLHFFISQSTNTGKSRGLILFCTQILLVSITVWPTCSIVPIIDTLDPVVPK